MRKRSLDTAAGAGAWLELLLPLDRAHVALVGSHAVAEAERLSVRYPWMSFWPHHAVTEDALSRNASKSLGGSRREDVDAVVLLDPLEGFSDSQAMLEVLSRCLSDEGIVLVAHATAGTSRPEPSGLREDLLHCGFQRADVYDLPRARVAQRRTGLALSRAWIKSVPANARLQQLTRWVYVRLSPEKPHASGDPLEIAANGWAWCAGYTLVLGEALCREAYPARWLTLIADGHPCGRGRHRRESHEVMEVECEGHAVVVDPTAGIVFSHSIAALLERPELADRVSTPDKRYLRRDYHLYATGFMYSRVRWVGLREEFWERKRYRSARRIRKGLAPPMPPRDPFSLHGGVQLSLWQRATQTLHSGLWAYRMGGAAHAVKALIEH